MQEFLVVTFFISANKIFYSFAACRSFFVKRFLFSLSLCVFLPLSIAASISHSLTPSRMHMRHSIHLLKIQIRTCLFVCGGTAIATAISIKCLQYVWCPCTWIMLLFTQFFDVCKRSKASAIDVIVSSIFARCNSLHSLRIVVLATSLFVLFGPISLFVAIKSITCCIWPVQIQLIVKMCAHCWPIADRFCILLLLVSL